MCFESFLVIVFEALGNYVWLATGNAEHARGRRKSARPRASEMSNALLPEWKKLGYDGRRISDDTPSSCTFFDTFPTSELHPQGECCYCCCLVYAKHIRSKKRKAQDR